MKRLKRYAILMILMITSVNTISNDNQQPIPSYRIDLNPKKTSSLSSTMSNVNDDNDDDDVLLDGPLDPLKVLCQVNGYRINAAIDTGSRVSTMSSSCAQRCRIYSKININQHTTTTTSRAGNYMLGTITNVPIELGPANFRTKLFIERSTCSNDDHDFVIGRDLLSLKKNALYMNYRNQNFKIPIIADGLETSIGGDDYNDKDEDDILFASHSWRKNDSNDHSKNDDNDIDNNNYYDNYENGEISDGDVMSMEGY